MEDKEWKDFNDIIKPLLKSIATQIIPSSQNINPSEFPEKSRRFARHSSMNPIG